jgi:hypothetical protein
LLAAKQSQELKNRMPAASKEEETKARVQRIKDALQEARRLAAGKQPNESKQAWLLCTKILDLYQHYPDFHDSPEPDVKNLVEQAQQLADQLRQLPEPKR